MPITRPHRARRHVLAGLTAATLAVPGLVAAADAIDTSGGTAHLAPSADVPIPARRFASCGALDAETRRLVVFGGRSEAGATHFTDAWSLDMESPDGRSRWEQVAPAGAPAAPPPTRSCAAAWDSDEDRLIVFGGWNGTTMRNGVWALDPETSTWSELCDAASCGTAPTARRAAAAAYDPARDRLVVFGGLDGSYRNDVWTLSLDGSPQWTAASIRGTKPTARASHTMTYDAGRDRVWVVAGTTSGSDLNDSWSLDLASMSWQQLATPGCPTACPLPRSGHVVGYDEMVDRLVLYGGLGSATNTIPPDAWALSGLDGTGAWTRLDAASAVPQARFVPVGAFDEAGRRLVVFGGGFGAAAYRDTVALHLPVDGDPSWRSIAPATPFTARDQVAATLSGDGVVTAFGGFGSGTFPGSLDAGMHVADTWQLRLGGEGKRQWRNVTSRDPLQVPLAREAVGLGHDAARNRTFLIGGLNGDVSLNDVWIARNGNGSVRWKQLCSPTSCGTAPEPRLGAHAIWDAEREHVVLFGGRRSDGSSLDDTWILDPAPTPHWKRVDTGSVRPPARWGGAAAYDPLRERMVVFGGQAGNDGAATPRADTWSLSLDGVPRWTELHPTGDAPTLAAALRTQPAAALAVAVSISS